MSLTSEIVEYMRSNPEQSTPTTEDGAIALVERARAAAGWPICPVCGCNEAYSYGRRNGRKLRKCMACGSQFSITSGTEFACRKLSFMKLLEVIRRAHGTTESARQIGISMGIEEKSAHYLVKKVRQEGLQL